MPRTCLLDLDGTLLDSAPDLHAALDRMAARRGLRGYALPEVHAMIGDGVTVLVQRALAARGAAFDPAAVAEYLADYEAHGSDATLPFPGVPEALAALAAAGWQLAVCTNKPERAARQVLAAAGLLPLLAAVAGGDTFPTRKPDPGHLLGTLRQLGVSGTAGVAMVGDHGNDVRAAQGAGITPVFAAWGYGQPAMAGDAVVARHPAELPGVLAALHA